MPTGAIGLEPVSLEAVDEGKDADLLKAREVLMERKRQGRTRTRIEWSADTARNCVKRDIYFLL